MKATRCPQCEAAVALTTPRPAHYPFCSERCQLIDLGRWLDEEYRVPEPEPPPHSLDRSEN